MSNAEDIIKAVEEKNQLFHGEYKEALEKTGNEYKESIVKMDKRLDAIQEGQDKLEKSSKAQTISKEMQRDESNQKQCAEFVKSIRAIASEKITHFKTNEMESELRILKAILRNNLTRIEFVLILLHRRLINLKQLTMLGPLQKKWNSLF